MKSSGEEREILAQAERRARQQYESVLSQQKQQNMLLTNLQAIQSNLEQSEFETKTKLGTQIESLERELLLARRKVEMEEERGQKVVESFRGGSVCRSVGGAGSAAQMEGVSGSVVCHVPDHCRPNY